MIPIHNRLAHESSPYLRQHADNPVAWLPWGEDAFSLARRLDKPIFLSIGYSTCHWCHVMAHESFEDEATAELLNQAFVCVKVDREERPDIDKVYMAVCQAMTGGGGWPLTVLMAPDASPFFSATYIPRESAFGRTGLKELAQAVETLWRTRKPEVLDQAGAILEHLRAAREMEGAADPDAASAGLPVGQLAADSARPPNSPRRTS